MAKNTLDNNGLAKASGTLTIYNFDSLTGEFTGSTVEFLPQGVGLPACTCVVAPPQADARSVAVYRDGVWQTVADHRGKTVYSVADGSAIVISEPGDYQVNTTPLKPATIWDKWDGEKWITDLAAEKAAALREAEEKQAALIAEANAITMAWQTQLRLDMITDADKSSLMAWMKYVQDVQAVNVEEAPIIKWPQKPQ